MMRYKQAISTILLAVWIICMLLLLLFWLMGCSDKKEIVSQVIIDKRHKPGRWSTRVQAIIIAGQPMVMTVPTYVSDQYSLTLLITYIDKTTDIKLVSVSSEVYNRAIIGEEWIR